MGNCENFTLIGITSDTPTGIWRTRIQSNPLHLDWDQADPDTDKLKTAEMPQNLFSGREAEEI